MRPNLRFRFNPYEEEDDVKSKYESEFVQISLIGRKKLLGLYVFIYLFFKITVSLCPCADGTVALTTALTVFCVISESKQGII